MDTNIATKKFSYTGTGSTAEVVFAQVPLSKSQLEKLKQRSGTTTAEDALQTAVNHYLERDEGEAEGAAEAEEEKRKRDMEKESASTHTHAEGLVFVSGKAKVKKPNHGHGHWNGHEHETNQKLLAIEMEIMSQGKRVRI